MSDDKGDKSKLERWCDWLAIAVGIIGIGLFIATLAVSLNKSPSDASLPSLSTLNAFFFAAVTLATLSLLLFILQLENWFGWLEIRRRGKAKPPPIWHIFALLLGLLCLALPIKSVDVSVTLPATKISP